MTNAEAYIGDEDLIDQFIDEFNEFACEQECDFKYHYLKETLVKFFQQEVKPTLTEDERVILRNLDGYTKIGRTEKDVAGYTDVYIEYENACESLSMFKSNLFQFIKERRRIRDSRTSFW